MHLLPKAEKKVEYLELIYDLIFVFAVGRNNSLLHHTENGFFSGSMFLTYVVCTLAVIQIWNYTTYYINLFGRNGVREHVSLFVNMFLMYFIAEGTRTDWSGYYVQYHVVWALILCNIGVQYWLELRHYRGDSAVRRQIVRLSLPLFVEAAAVLGAMALYLAAGLELSWAAILLGILASFTMRGSIDAFKVDFPHLTERAMLYVVFTFGEMIIGISGYFEGGFTLNSLYFSLMAFLIVVALFLSYETVYDHIVDRERESDGMLYIFIHIFLVFALNNVTAALEFMRDTAVALVPKILFLTGSLLLYYVCLFLLGRFAKQRCGFTPRFYLAMAGVGVSFIVLMFLFREWMALNIAFTVVYVFGVFFVLRHIGRKSKEEVQRI